MYLWCIDAHVSEQPTASVINWKILQPSIKLHVVPSGSVDAHDFEEIIVHTHTHTHTHTLSLSDYHISLIKQEFVVTHLHTLLQETEKT